MYTYETLITIWFHIIIASMGSLQHLNASNLGLGLYLDRLCGRKVIRPSGLLTDHHDTHFGL